MTALAQAMSVIAAVVAASVIVLDPARAVVQAVGTALATVMLGAAQAAGIVASSAEAPAASIGAAHAQAAAEALRALEARAAAAAFPEVVAVPEVPEAAVAAGGSKS